MTRRDIRRSINSQLLTVFFLPLVLAGVHLAFAFPLLQKMLLLFNVLNVRLLILTTSVSFLIFAVFYVIVYRFTAGRLLQDRGRAGIVSGMPAAAGCQWSPAGVPVAACRQQPPALLLKRGKSQRLAGEPPAKRRQTTSVSRGYPCQKQFYDRRR